MSLTIQDLQYSFTNITKMRVFIILVLLAVCFNQVYSDERKCFFAVGACDKQHKDIIDNIKDKTCEQKAPIFKCLKDNHCSEVDNNYKERVQLYKYESCGASGASGASAIIMGWTLPILMFSLAKYFSK